MLTNKKKVMSKIAYVLAGVAIGMLIAPAKGSEMRSGLLKRIRKYADDTDEAVAGISRVADAKAEEFQQKMFLKADNITRTVEEQF
ncbi:MAG: YtxH domain-containing protein [Chitinophagaceae bacterium]|nr:MAG: YtxH domain-containing protein [Chitinophagaceae bacterium]